jgi:IS605 OrfB family transposase
MHLTAEIKLLPTPEQSDALRRTLVEANLAADWLSEQAFQRKVFRQFALHRLGYHEMRERFALSAQMTVRVIGKVADSYKIDKRVVRRFRPTGAIPYDTRILRYTESTVSIWTVEGRQTIPFECGESQRAMLLAQKGESDLILRDGCFYLAAGCEIETPETFEPDGWLGVDLGIVNIATTSDGQPFAGAQLNGLRHRHRRLRAKLDAKGTKSAKRLLRKRARREARMAKDVNHCISKSIVAEAERTRRGIALEELKGIRRRVRARRPQRATLNSWAFNQLGEFISYKAALAGVPVEFVDPRNTSKTCPECGHCDKRNRPSQAVFMCVRCSFAGEADHIAARNIASRAAVNRPNGSEICAVEKVHG